MTHLSHNERTIVVTALKHAAPYIRMFKRKVFVLKAGGEAFLSPTTTKAIVEQISILHEVGINVVVVHGGGPQSTKLAKEKNIPLKIIDGRRVTNGETLAVMAKVLNEQINPMIQAAFADLGVPTVGIAGSEARVIKAHKRPPTDGAGPNGETIDYGFVGNIDAIDAGILLGHIANSVVPIISPMAVDENGTLLNINADTVAAAVASALGAEKLILATSAPGILESRDDTRSLISYIDIAGLAKLRAEGRIADGMLPKAAAIEKALTSGVPRVHVISSELPDSLLLEIFTNEGMGTLVVNNIEHLSPAEQT
ncbi:MAG: acetylglutamate kinase [Candidatus Rariloculaceae bacterium]